MIKMQCRCGGKFICEMVDAKEIAQADKWVEAHAICLQPEQKSGWPYQSPNIVPYVQQPAYPGVFPKDPTYPGEFTCNQNDIQPTVFTDKEVKA